MDASGIGCYCVTSPVGKYAVDTDPGKMERQLERSIEAANVLGSRWICASSRSRRATGRPAAADRDAIKRARSSGWCEPSKLPATATVPLLENNYRMYTLDGDTTLDLLSDYEPGQVALAFDAHAYVVSEVRPFDEAWVQGRSRGCGCCT